MIVKGLSKKLFNDFYLLKNLENSAKGISTRRAGTAYPSAIADASPVAEQFAQKKAMERPPQAKKTAPAAARGIFEHGGGGVGEKFNAGLVIPACIVATTRKSNS